MKKWCFRVLVCGCLLQVLCINALADVGDAGSSKGFPDVSDTAPYASAVQYLQEMEIIGGDEKGNFNPNHSITRAETAVILCKFMGVVNDVNTLSSDFIDVKNHWGSGYIARAADLGIIQGYGDGRFGPNDPVTHEQILKMLVCAWGEEQSAQELGGYPNGYLTVAKNLGITGDNTFNSKNPALRSEVAVYVYNSIH